MNEIERFIRLLQQAKPVVMGWFRSDGWVPLPELTFVSATSFTLPGNWTGLLKIGVKFSCFNASTKYGYILSSTYNGGTGLTTVNLVPNTSYNLVSGAISDARISVSDPPDFPQLFTWTPVVTGFSSAPTFGAVFSLTGGMCHIVVFPTAPGTSNATTFTMSVPIASRAATVYTYGLIPKLVNNGIEPATPGMIELATSSSVMNLFTSCNNGAWASSNGKYAYIEFSYPFM